MGAHYNTRFFSLVKGTHTMEPLRLGIIGCGVIGNNHAQAAAESDLISLDAVADVNEAAAQKAAEEYGAGTVYDSGETLISDDSVEAVVLALPTGIRLPLVLKAFSSGKHVLSEKPIAMCADDVKTMIRARGDLTAGCCSSRNRLSDRAARACEFLHKGSLGNIRLIRCRAVVPAGPKPETLRPAWRLKKELNGGGIMANWGCYDLDYLFGLLDWSFEPETVFAKTWQIPEPFRSHVVEGSDAETHVSALISFKQGAVFQYERGEYMAVPESTEWEITGENGTLHLCMLPWKEGTTVYTRADAEQGAVSETLWEDENTHALTARCLLEDFARAVREKRQPMTGLEQALVVQSVTDAIYRSSETGTCVRV